MKEKVKGKKVRKYSILRKMVFIGCIVTFVASFIIAYMTCQTNEQNLNQAGKEQSEAAIKLMKGLINPKDVDAINKLDPKKAEQDPTYLRLNATLSSVVRSEAIKFLYMIKEENGKYLMTVDCYGLKEQGHVPYGSECPPGVDYDNVFKKGEGFTTGIEKNDYGTLISSYFPMQDESGKIIAIFASGYDASGIQSQIDKTDRMSLLFLGVTFILFMPAIFIMIKAITKNINRVNSKLEDLVSNNGDLTRKIEVTSGDELELVADNVNALLEFIRKIMSAIHKNSNNIKDASADMANSLETSNESIVDVSAVMEEMSSSMEESSASISKVSESVEEVFSKVKNVYSKAHEGAVMAEEIQKKAVTTYDAAVKHQDDAKQKALEMSNSVDEKIKRSKSVDEISMLTENILNITDQTSLLALNASIEAARSGEAGKGFAVVASEIEKLAKNSAEAATQIRQVSEEVICAVEDLAGEAKRMMEFMETTALAGYDKLIDTSKDYKDDAEVFKGSMDNFASESKELEVITEGINESVSCINTAIEETAKGVVSVAETATVLTAEMGEIGNKANGNRDIAQELMAEVNKFKLE